MSELIFALGIPAIVIVACGLYILGRRHGYRDWLNDYTLSRKQKE